MRGARDGAGSTPRGDLAARPRRRRQRLRADPAATGAARVAAVAFRVPACAGEAERGVAESGIVLAGFSQGGAIALATGLRHPRKLAGIVALSTYLPIAETTRSE